MPELKCPVCGEVLRPAEKTLQCVRGHSYDRARQGYVNLLMSNAASAKRHGDDRQMVLARQAFLEKGYYGCLRDALCAAALQHTSGSVELLDAGCGEGWYTCAVRDALTQAGRACHACGVDISREALKCAARRDRTLTLAVSSVSALPVRDGSCDLVLSVFAPTHDAEFRRVLRPGGILLRAVPLEEHLWGLKAAVYDRPYRNPAPRGETEGFRLLDRREIRDRLTLTDPEEIRQLFQMTPYYYKTGRADQAKLLALDRLETELAFCVFALERV